MARAGRVVRPDLLGDEGHERVQQREHPLQRVEQRRRDLGLALVEARLGDLQVPVAELRPEERVGLLGGVGEVVGLELAVTEAIVRSSRERIQRSSTCSGRGSGADLARVEQDQPAPAFQSLLVQVAGLGPTLASE